MVNNLRLLLSGRRTEACWSETHKRVLTAAKGMERTGGISPPHLFKQCFNKGGILQWTTQTHVISQKLSWTDLDQFQQNMKRNRLENILCIKKIKLILWTIRIFLHCDISFMAIKICIETFFILFLFWGNIYFDILQVRGFQSLWWQGPPNMNLVWGTPYANLYLYCSSFDNRSFIAALQRKLPYKPQ